MTQYLPFHGVSEYTTDCTLLVRGANVASNAFGAVHILRHTEGGGEGVSASVTSYTLSIHQYGTSYDEGEGGGVCS